MDFCAGLWIAACARFALDHLEAPKSHQGDHITFFSVLTIDSKMQSTAACASVLVLTTFATSLTRSALFMNVPFLHIEFQVEHCLE